MSFVKVKEGSPAGEQDAEGWKWIEIEQYSRADDSVDPCDGKQKAKRRDDGNSQKSHVYSVCW